MRLMADACNPANLPGWALEATYVDGICASNASTKVRMSSLGTNAGNGLDCEPGNPLKGVEVAYWTRERRAAGEPWIIVYCFATGTNGVQNGSGYTWYDLIQAFASIGEPEPIWWIAIPASARVGDATPIPAGAGMVQVYYDVPPGYDTSFVLDYIPKFDPDPPTPDPPPPDPPPPLEVAIPDMYNDMAYDEQNDQQHYVNLQDMGSGRAAIWYNGWDSKTSKWLGPVQIGNEDALLAGGIRCMIMSNQLHVVYTPFTAGNDSSIHYYVELPLTAGEVKFVESLFP